MGKLSQMVTVLLGSILLSCAYQNITDVSKKRYSANQLKYDYSVLQSVLEKKHPSLYWYTSRDSMQYYFRYFMECIKDSMSEQQFAWKILHPLVNKIHCGHTEVNQSKSYQREENKSKQTSFPLYIKFWNDTAAVVESMYQKDSVFKEGTIITSINGLPTREIIQQMKDYFSEDGYAVNSTYLKISFNFPYYYKNIFGLQNENEIEYLDSLGGTKKTILQNINPLNPSTTKTVIDTQSSPHRKHVSKIKQYRTFEIDSSNKFAVMRLNTFSEGNLRKFFRKSFKECNKNKTPNLILDVRLNGGGKVNNSTLLTKYLSRKPFKVVDTVYSISKTLSPFNKYFKSALLNNLELQFISKRKKDNKYHLILFEKKWYSPKKQYHFNGKVYILTSGLTFSATCLLVNALKGQPDITLVGEETGGGWYGNSGILIPAIILPETKINISIPLFRVVQFNHPSIQGSGILPDIIINTSYDAIKKGYDKKMTVVKQMILHSSDNKKFEQ